MGFAKITEIMRLFGKKEDKNCILPIMDHLNTDEWSFSGSKKKKEPI